MFDRFVRVVFVGVVSIASFVLAIVILDVWAPNLPLPRFSWEPAVSGVEANTNATEHLKGQSGPTFKKAGQAADETGDPVASAIVLPDPVGTLDQGAWKVTFYEGVTDQMRGWFEDLHDPAPALWPTFPNEANPLVPDFRTMPCPDNPQEICVPDGLEYGLDERNYCDNDICDVLVPARGYNLITAEYAINGLECHTEDGAGCGIVLFNVGEVTANFEDVMVNNGFSVDGRYWNGDVLYWGIWGVVSHQSANMLNYATNGAGNDTLNRPDRTNAGANCSVPVGCAGVLWRVVITSGNQILVVAETTVK